VIQPAAAQAASVARGRGDAAARDGAPVAGRDRRPGRSWHGFRRKARASGNRAACGRAGARGVRERLGEGGAVAGRVGRRVRVRVRGGGRYISMFATFRHCHGELYDNRSCHVPVSGVDFYDMDSLLSEEERAVRDTVRAWVRQPHAGDRRRLYQG
jgi:hypothetical protein